MTTPVYVVAGFLGSGKTTFLSRMLHTRRKKKVLAIQFEDGEETLGENDMKTSGSRRMDWTKEELEQEYDRVLEVITEEIKLHEYEEIWVEWNGMESFSKLEQIFLQMRIKLYVHIEKVIYLAEAEQTEFLLGRTGEGPVSQVAASDVAFLRGKKKGDGLRQKLSSISPALELRGLTKKNVREEMTKRNVSQILELVGISMAAGMLFLLTPLFQQRGIPLLTMFTISMGVFLQGVPFLLLGVLLSSAIQVLLPKDWLLKAFPKNPVLGMATGVVSGFFLPVCDCASIPVFHSLLKKGVPLPAAVCFMTAAPVVNPVVLMSTYYAFNCDYHAVLYRTGLGILGSLLIGLTFWVWNTADFYKDYAGSIPFCTCGCYEEGGAEQGPLGKTQLFLRHAQLEFYSVGKYLLIGILISTLFQMMDLTRLKILGNSSLPVAVLVMILLSFLLSLCSSSDAVVARSMSGTFGFTPLLGFLVFGPMIDIKNIMMLNGYFQKKFVWRLALTTFLVCFAVVMILGPLCGGVAV